MSSKTRNNAFTALFAFAFIALISFLAGSALAAPVKYFYDDLNRLERVEYPDGTVIKYEYDKLGNRTYMEIFKDANTVMAPVRYIADHGGCPNLPVRIAGAVPRYFADLQSAYNAATSGDVIQVQGVDLIGGFYADRDIAVALQGGYDCAYASWVRDTNLKGMITTNCGTLTAMDFVLQE